MWMEEAKTPTPAAAASSTKVGTSVSRGTAATAGAGTATGATIATASSAGRERRTIENSLFGCRLYGRTGVGSGGGVFEIEVDLPDMTQMQSRDVGLDGGAEITLRDLVREALRQRPDRIVVGEVRGPEALDMLMALNAGWPSGIDGNSLRRTGLRARDRILSSPPSSATRISPVGSTRR